MKHIPAIAGGLLGLLFIVFGLNFFLNFIPVPEGPPPPAEVLSFMGALVPTGYLKFVKILEILGGLLVALPKTRNWGLLVLGPILVNILCFHAFLQKGEGLFSPMLIGLCALAVYLLWDARKKFAGLLN